MDRNETLSEKWDKAAESWADFVRKGKYFYRDHLTAPAFLQLLGCVREKEMLDLACDEGVNARLLARKGAKVTAVDFSRKLIALAIQREKKAPLGIRYCVSKASCLSMSSSAKFDVAICYMSLQDIKDYQKAISEVARVLKEKGRFLFSIPHPCFEGVVVRGKKLRAGKMMPVPEVLRISR